EFKLRFFVGCEQRDDHSARTKCLAPPVNLVFQPLATIWPSGHRQPACVWPRFIDPVKACGDHSGSFLSLAKISRGSASTSILQCPKRRVGHLCLQYMPSIYGNLFPMASHQVSRAG